MGICTQCGVIIHDDDITKHVCTNPVVKGKEKRPTYTEVSI